MTVAALSLAACNVSDYQVKAAPQEPGTLHLQNGYLPAGPIDIYVDGAKAVSSLAFGDTITLTNLPYGARHLRYADAGVNDSFPVTANPVYVSSQRMYTEVLAGDAASGGGLALLGGQVSSASVSPSVNAGLRLYDALDVGDYVPVLPNPDSTWKGNLGVTLIGQTTGFTLTAVLNQFGSIPGVVGRQIAAGFQSLPPDTYSLIIYNNDPYTLAGAIDTLVSTGLTITLKQGELRTATLVGFGPAQNKPSPIVRLLPVVLADSGQ